MERSHAETRQPGPGMLSWHHTGMHKLGCTNRERSSQPTQPVVSAPPKLRPGGKGPGGSRTPGPNSLCPTARLADQWVRCAPSTGKGAPASEGFGKAEEGGQEGGRKQTITAGVFSLPSSHIVIGSKDLSPKSLVLVLKV